MSKNKNLTCKKISSFVKDEFKANKIYANLSKTAKPKSAKDLLHMSGEEGAHNHFLLNDMAVEYGCNQKKWFKRRVSKKLVQSAIIK